MTHVSHRQKEVAGSSYPDPEQCPQRAWKQKQASTRYPAGLSPFHRAYDYNYIFK